MKTIKQNANFGTGKVQTLYTKVKRGGKVLDLDPEEKPLFEELDALTHQELSTYTPWLHYFKDFDEARARALYERQEQDFKPTDPLACYYRVNCDMAAFLPNCHDNNEAQDIIQAAYVQFPADAPLPHLGTLEYDSECDQFNAYTTHLGEALRLDMWLFRIYIQPTLTIVQFILSTDESRA